MPISYRESRKGNRLRTRKHLDLLRYHFRWIWGQLTQSTRLQVSVYLDCWSPERFARWLGYGETLG